jgi:hypothetical protein
MKLQGAATLNEINDQHHYGDDEKDVNESSEGIGANQSQQPEHKQNDEDSPKHTDIPFRLRF